MRKLLQNWFRQPVIRLANKFSSRPDKQRVFEALTKLHGEISSGEIKKGLVLSFNITDKFVVLSDQHKGAKNGFDDFASNEKNYLAALDYYYTNQYFYINLGDSEELWENTLAPVKKNNIPSFEKEKLFLQNNKFIKIFGNHDLYWGNDIITAPLELKNIYGQDVTIYEGVILQTTINEKSFQIYLTHGHQGDLQSDGNWFSKWFVAMIWSRIQAYLEINPNTPAYDTQLKTEHNKLMYEWSSDNNIVLITGHTHQPVFESLTLMERLYDKLAEAKKAADEKAIAEIESHINHQFQKGEILPDYTGFKPNYFNSGCCCFSDGDITGIEIDNGCIRLIKWEYDEANNPQRIILEESELTKLAEQMKVDITT